jgi:hypothetical protein
VANHFGESAFITGNVLSARLAAGDRKLYSFIVRDSLYLEGEGRSEIETWQRSAAGLHASRDSFYRTEATFRPSGGGLLCTDPVSEEEGLYDWRMAIPHSQWETPKSECVIGKKNTIETQQARE